MDRFYGFDLGDAESAVARLSKESHEAPEILSVAEAKSFITAYALSKDGQLLVGEKACYEPNVNERKLRFKSRFLTDKNSKKDVKSFASGVLGELYGNGDLLKGDDSCFYVGCPAGWNKLTREEYREIFESIGYPPVKIISESRAALVSACQSKYLQVGYDILSQPVLVVDIGSSTTDFAYISGGKEEELKTGGEVFLGGGIMDEILLEDALSNSFDGKRIRRMFEESSVWKTYAEFAARRLKEKYFSDEDYWKENDCVQNVSIRQNLLPARLTLKMNAQVADKLINQKVEKLENRSFKQVFTDALKQIAKNLEGKEPELIFLTGGVSKLPAIRDWCAEVFPEAVVIRGSEPEFSVASGLAYCGKIDEELREFKKDVDALRASNVVEDIVSENIQKLYRKTVDALVDPILKEVALPIADLWREGTLEKLSDIDEKLQEGIDDYLHTEEARHLLQKPIGEWLKDVSYALEKHTMPICIKHNVPYGALNLNSFLSVSDIDVKVESKDIFAVEEITWLIDGIISIIVGLLCGGSGVAMIANGLPGIIAGAILSIMVLALGKEKMQDALLNANLPNAVRKLLPKSFFTSRIDHISEDVRNGLLENLAKEKNDDISGRLIKDISEQIESCLGKMAEVVEIPLV